MTQEELVKRLELLKVHTQEAEFWIKSNHAERRDEQALKWLDTHYMAINLLIDAIK